MSDYEIKLPDVRDPASVRRWKSLTIATPDELELLLDRALSWIDELQKKSESRANGPPSHCDAATR